MKSYSSKDIISLLEADGWYPVRVRGDHHHFKHPAKPGVVTVPHPLKDIPMKTAISIAKQAGITLT
ncbi:MAG: type II toxin-antitoxin system HicA family toxin [Eubacteriales bacterium]|nr:type II toxin-antitoxin system HicA family toxin [Eubacteriales bacterium]